jgi:MSHA biogenesis protein MshJ
MVDPRVWLEQFERLSLRERALIAAALLFALYQVWSLLLHGPQDRQLSGLQEQLQRDSAAVTSAGQQVRELQRRLASSGEGGIRAETERLETQLRGTEARIQSISRDLVSPSDMNRLLEELLSREPSLSLLRLETLGSRQVIPIPIDRPEEAVRVDSPQYRVFRHDFAIEFSGGYLATLRYLEALDQLPWRFYWDGIRYQVEEHPRGRVRLQLYTLSLSEGWIGV